MLCFLVAARVQNASDPVTCNPWRAGEGGMGCMSQCWRDRGGGVSVTPSRSAIWAFLSIIRIQHTHCKLQQMGSSLEWQLRVCCHTELQLACQSQAAPRSFLHHPHIPPLLSNTFYFFPSLLHLTHSLFFFTFSTSDLSILPVLLSCKSTILLNPPVLLSTWNKPSGNTCYMLMDPEVQGVLEIWMQSKQKGRITEDVGVYTVGVSSQQELRAARFLFYELGCETGKHPRDRWERESKNLWEQFT